MTREEAKKRLEVWLICGECPEDKQCYDSYLHSTCEYTDYCDEVSLTDAVKMAISALSENKGEWIPVSERLPDNNVRVLCSAISTSISGGYTRFVGCCNNGFWFVQTDAETVSYPRQYKVTAWMPLPSPWKGE